MFYISTRNQNIKKSAAEAILMGIADDGGLYVPNDLKSASFPMDKLLELSEMDIDIKIGEASNRIILAEKIHL